MDALLHCKQAILYHDGNAGASRGGKRHREFSIETFIAHFIDSIMLTI